MRSQQEVVRAIRTYADTVRRVCFVYLKNEADTEDIFQEVFLKYALSSAAFESPEHERAWIIRVSINACKDLLRSVFRRRTVPLEEAEQTGAPESGEGSAVLEALERLPQKYRSVIYLHYYEGYTAKEIGGILGKRENTVYTLLARGRAQLRDRLEGDGDGEAGSGRI